MSSHRKLRKSGFIWDSGGTCYKQEIGITEKELEHLQNAIHSEISLGYPRAKEYSNGATNYLQPISIVGANDNLGFLNLTTTRFINLFLKLKLVDENTYLLVREEPKNIMSIEDFDEIYEPIENPLNEDSGTLFETYGADLDYVLNVANTTPHKVWTLVDSDEGLVIVSGYHLVNRVHYIITKNDWIDINNIVLYCDELVENGESGVGQVVGA
jgi:hypothetical protein